jgi:hypothetical protein
VYARYFLDVALVALGHCVSEHVATCQQKKSENLECGHDKARSYPIRGLFCGCNFVAPRWFDPIVLTVHDVHRVFVGVRGFFSTSLMITLRTPLKIEPSCTMGLNDFPNNTRVATTPGTDSFMDHTRPLVC